MKLYIDSNVLISLVRGEITRNIKLLYHETEKFFEFCKRDEISLVISELFLREVKSNIGLNNYEEILEYFNSIFKIKYECVLFSAEVKARGKEFESMGIHFPDSVHAAFALNTGCKYLVTWNKKDFLPIENLIRVISPDEAESRIQ